MELTRPAFLPAITPQIQVCLRCNQSCTYCFQKHSGQTIAVDTVRSILTQTIHFNSQRIIHSDTLQQPVYWHGGEPLLAGIDFYKSVVNMESEFHNVHFQNRIQTNGTLLTESFAHFFAKHQFDVGFSLDGPEHLHNLHRRYSTVSGLNGTFIDVMAGIELYRKARIPDKIPVICVITKESTRSAKELFHFFKELHASVQLDIYDLRTQDFHPDNALPLFQIAPEVDELKDFLIELFDLWFHDTSGQVDFKDLRNEVKLVLQPEMNLGDPYHKRRCDIRRTIFDPAGYVYSCDQYINDQQTALGNIAGDNLERMITRKMYLWEEIKHHIRFDTSQMACNTCRWGRCCNGGCITCMKYNSRLAAARRAEMADSDWTKMSEDAGLAALSGEFYYCKALQSLRSHIEQSISQIIEKEAP